MRGTLMSNSLFDLFQDPGVNPAADQLIVGGRYKLPPISDPTGERRSLQRVTNFVKQISDEGGLTRWKLRSVITGLAYREDLYDLACSIDPASQRGKQELDELAERCIDQAKAHQGSTGNETGTALHNYTDNVGHTPTRVRDKWVPKVENYRMALHEQGLRAVPGLSERLVISERYGIAGRLDDVYEDPFGVLRVGDRKSQKDFYTWFEIGAQLACYQGADAMWNEQECRFEDMPKLADDFGVVAWMPLSHPGGNPDEVELFRVPLAPARELLQVLATVRELRTTARRWGQSMPALDDFARIARDIRDAETFDDLRTLAALNPALSMEGDPLNRMAAARWDEITLLAIEERQSSPIVPPAPTALCSVEQANQDGAHFAQVARVDQLPAAEFALTGVPAFAGQNTVTDLLALFQSPSVDATFPETTDHLHAHDVGPALPAPVSGLTGGVLRTPDDWCTLLGVVVRDPDGWRGHRELGPRAWSDPISHGEFQLRYAVSTVEIGPDPRIVDGVTQRPSSTAEREAYAARLQAHPVATAPHTNAFNHGATVVELPSAPDALPTSKTDVESAIEALSTVPLKIVKEVATRAANSKSSRGRVRLLNDVEENKYAAHGVELMPALLREWLDLDGGEEETSAGVAIVRDTGGSKRPAMHADLAGQVSLTSYLKTLGEEVPERAAKKGSAAPAQGVDAFGQPLEAPADDEPRTYGMTTFGPIVKGEDGLLYVQAAKDDHDISGEVRDAYHDVRDHPGTFSVPDLVMLAKDGRNAHERGIAILEIARREAMTSAIADELDGHYREHGYAGNFSSPPAPANNKPGKRNEYMPDYLREVTLHELRQLALNVETPGERGQILFEFGRRDAWDRMPVTQIDVAWRNEGLAGVPAMSPERTSREYVLGRIAQVKDLSDQHALWAELMHLPVFHTEEVQDALYGRGNRSYHPTTC